MIEHTKKKKNKLKVYLGRVSRLSAIFLGGSYILSGFSYGFKNINKTIKCDINAATYDMDYLTLDMESRNIDDLRINDMAKFDTLKIDMAHSKNLSFISYCTNLKSVEISNAQLLTDDDIKSLNFSNIEEIYLFFDRDATINDLNVGFDLDRFKNKSFIKNVDFIHKKGKDGYVTYNKESDSIIFFEYFRNYEDCKLEFMKYSKLNDEINRIVDIIDEDEYEAQIEYLFSIVDYICERMDYDKDVKNLSDDDSMFEKRKINRRIDNYNIHSLSKGIAKDTSRVVDGVCINYADALSTLGIKKGFNIHTVTGNCEGKGHAWNIVNFGGYYYLIDLTNYEKINTTFKYIKSYRENPTEENYEAILSNLLIMINNESLDYFHSSLNILDYVEPKAELNSTQNIYGTNANKYSVALYNGVLSWGAYFLLCMGVVSAEVIKQKREYKKNKGVLKKSLDRFTA